MVAIRGGFGGTVVVNGLDLGEWWLQSEGSKYGSRLWKTTMIQGYSPTIEGYQLTL